jgi:hypothetical protein
MNKKGRAAPHDDDDAVGYGRPPRGKRFRSGQSGNPKGRPKGSRGIDKILRDALSRRVRVQEEGKARIFTLIEVIILRLVNDAAKMDAKALKILIPLMDRYGGTSETAVDMRALTAEDHLILAGYLAEQKEAGAKDDWNSPAETNNGDPGASDADSG